MTLACTRASVASLFACMAWKDNMNLIVELWKRQAITAKATASEEAQDKSYLAMILTVGINGRADMANSSICLGPRIRD